MASKFLKETLTKYESKRQSAIMLAENKKLDFYKKNPKLQDAEFKLNSLSAKLTKAILTNSSDVKNIKKEIAEIKKKKKELEEKAHYKEKDFLPIFECSKCEDTGFIKTGITSSMCSCLKQQLFDTEYNKLNTYNIRNTSFNNFSLSKYSNKIDKDRYNSDISPRENIKIIKEVVDNFIKNFDDPNEKNLLFVGNTGLGKTFLSSCIANYFVNNGKTVLYQTAPVMLEQLINFHMNKTDTNILDYLLSVDLLIIDDLGTENINSMKFSDLYTIINSRLLNQTNKITKTIISTNLNLEELEKMYGERIISRFAGDYNICYFFGDDIRFNK